jgi:ribosomal protein S18
MSEVQTQTQPPAKKSFFKRRKTCPFSGPNSPAIDWKNIRILGRFISERGKIMPKPDHLCFSKETACSCHRHQASAVHGFAALCSD